MSGRQVSIRALAACVVILVLSATTIGPASAQVADELVGYTLRADPVITDEWADPAAVLGLEEDDLEPVPEFDFSSLHDSTIFASGVDWMEVENDPLPEARVRHLRVLQVVDTLERHIAETGARLRVLRPRVDNLNASISHERREEARLEAEISLLEKAITEFAVRAFIGEEELGTAFSVPDTELSENRVVVTQVRDGQFEDIADREHELARRRDRRARHESDRRSLRREISQLKSFRDIRFGQLRQMRVLSGQTEAGYQSVLHQRLDSMVRGTDIPLVTLNAYVIATRILETEQPSCGIEWWMLAGVGLIESQHGEINDADLDVNGTTTRPITGPALDGRILSGSEFLGDGQAAPPPTDRTVATTLQVEGSESAVGEDGEPAAPVVKRLALIRDTDDGRLDNDRTYDRAVGPMQFIPQTWRQNEADANRDGTADPQNVYDATLAAARYLCAAGSMVSEDGQKRAYFSYNHDDEYTENVLTASLRYRRDIRIPSPTETLTTRLGIAETRADLDSILLALELSVARAGVADF